MHPEPHVSIGELTPELFILTHVVPTALRAASQCGVNVQEFMQDQGISPLSLIPGHGALPILELFHLLNEGTRTGWSARPGGHAPVLFADSFNFDYLPDAAGYLFSSPTLKEASKVFNWVGPLYCPPARFEFHWNKELVTIILSFDGEYRDPKVSWAASETLLATWYSLASRLSSRLEAPLRVEFKHPPHAMRESCDSFFGRACAFSASHNAITLSRACVEHPLESSLPDLHAYSKARLLRLLDGYAGKRHRGVQVLLALEDEPADVCGLAKRIFDHYVQDPLSLRGTISDLATALDLPVRTLQRRLNESDTSFSWVHAKARLFVAKHQLLERALTIDDIALNVGFPDKRTFASFFKRRTGQTPREWRRSRGVR